MPSSKERTAGNKRHYPIYGTRKVKKVQKPSSEEEMDQLRKSVMGLHIQESVNAKAPMIPIKDQD